MLLVEVTINAVVNYVSIDGHALTNNWRPRILSFDAPQISIPSNHGGYGQMTFGSITFSQELFSGDWPPPRTCAISIHYTDTTEAAKETIFTGTAELRSFNREAVTYSLMASDYDDTIADATAYNNTLNTILTTILTTIPEIVSVDTTYARASSPNVTHTVSGETLAIELASAIAQFYSHLFYVVGTTAYLVDMLLSNGSDWTLTEYDFFASPTYTYNTPVAVATCEVGAVLVKRFSAYPYGTELSVDGYHTTEANIITACDNILTIENSPRVSLDVPMIAGNFPKLGQKIIIPDTAHVADLASWIRVRSMTFDFLGDKITVEGEGAIAAG